jgi:hypothetical protein
MVDRPVNRVSVWLDDSAPGRGAFAQGVEWASRLGLPLRAMVASDRRLRGVSADGLPACSEPMPERLAACEAACAQRGVAMECAWWEGAVAAGVKQFLSPSSLCVFGKALCDSGARIELVHQSLDAPDVPLLIAPQVSQPIARVLIVNQPSDTVGDFLGSVAWLCGALRVTPIVLTVAPTEREATRRSDAAREAWSGTGLAADFDLLAGDDAQEAVASVSRWRRCTHIVVERQVTSPWQRWLRGSFLERWLCLSDSFGLLTVPAARAAAPSKGERSPLLSAAGSTASAARRVAQP